jgi:hypothetical protein
MDSPTEAISLEENMKKANIADMYVINKVISPSFPVITHRPLLHLGAQQLRDLKNKLLS